MNAEERTQIGKFLQRIEFSRDIEEQPRTGKFSVHDMKTLEEYDIVKDGTDHESAKKYFLDLTKTKIGEAATWILRYFNKVPSTKNGGSIRSLWCLIKINRL